jgi:hypothetical protein
MYFVRIPAYFILEGDNTTYEDIKSHQIHDFCDHNEQLNWYYENKLYCDECLPENADKNKTIKIFQNDHKCGICLEVTYLDVIYECGHMFCQNCINELEKQSNKCPICRI